MKIIGFTLNKINAEKIKPIKGKLEIKSGINVDDIVKAEASVSDKSALKIDFTFKIEYEPEYGKLELKGSIVLLDEKDESKDILKDWKKKKFDHTMKIGLFNFIMERCNLKTLQLEEELGLPFHIPFPKLAPAPNQSTTKEEKNDNPANYAG